MRGLVELLVMAARPYTFTHMVAGNVSDPWERRRCGLFQRAAIKCKPETTDKNTDTSDIAVHDIHCDNTNPDGENHTAAVAPSRTHTISNSAGLQRSRGRVAAASATSTNKRQDQTTPAVKTIRLRGSGGESQAQLNALVELSLDGNALFKKLFRKVLVLLYNKGGCLSDIMYNYSLTEINNTVTDYEATDDVWASYGARIAWNDDCDGSYDSGYEDEDEFYDCCEDTDDWYEGEEHVGVITYWNYDSNYGTIAAMDDYTQAGMDDIWTLFCHGSNFVDGDACTLNEWDHVQFTVTWDYARDRWQAMHIAEMTDDAYNACYEKLGMSDEAIDFWFDYAP